MTIKLYGIMGTLAHEKTPVWTCRKPTDMSCALTATVDIPKSLNPYTADDGMVIITLDGLRYTLDEVLRDENNTPVISWSVNGTPARRILHLKESQP